MILRPSGLILDGELRWGLEAEIRNRALVDVRPHSRLPEPYVLSHAFTNAHSHLEYRGMQGRFQGLEYPTWIAAITAAKREESDAQVREACHLAAAENRATGVYAILEHSDRPFAGEAMAGAGLGGTIYQEVITLAESRVPEAKLAEVEARAERQRECFPRVFVNPHAAHTVDPATLRELGARGTPISIHLAETEAERWLFRDHAGPLADLYARLRAPLPPRFNSAVDFCQSLGLLRPGTQVVHACDVLSEEIGALAAAGVSVAHCPRSNEALRCPVPPIRALLDAGIPVGLGLDSAASSGPIDMFAEMRAACEQAARRGDTLTGEEIWHMATGVTTAKTPLIKIHLPDAQTTDDVIAAGRPDLVEWI